MTHHTVSPKIPVGHYKLKNLYVDDMFGLVRGNLFLQGKEIGKISKDGHGMSVILETQGNAEFSKFLAENTVKEEDMLGTLVTITQNNRKRKVIFAVGEAHPAPMNIHHDPDKYDTYVFLADMPRTISDADLLQQLSEDYPGEKLWRWSKIDSDYIPLN